MDPLPLSEVVAVSREVAATSSRLAKRSLIADALRAAGCERIFEDCASGARSDRPGLAEALAYLREGDVLVIWKFDRLGRSMAELVALVDELGKRGVCLKVLTGAGAALDTTRPEGRFIFGVFAAFAEFEREMIRERTREGIKAARRRGKRPGRPPSLTPEKLDMAQQLIADGKGKATAARMVGVDPATLRRRLNSGVCQ